MLGKSIFDSIQNKRIHHQLLPMELEYEQGFDQVVKLFIKLHPKKQILYTVD